MTVPCPHCGGPIDVRIVAGAGRSGDRAVSTADVAAEILQVIVEHGPLPTAGVVRLVRRRRQAVLSALRDLRDTGQAEDTADGWQAVPTPPEPPQRASEAAFTGSTLGTSTLAPTSPFNLAENEYA